MRLEPATPELGQAMRLDPATLSAVLDGLLPDWRDRRLCVALSGGLDSVVLLDLLADAVPVSAALRAVYVDHQLHPESASWGRHCRRICARLGVACSSRKVDVQRKGARGIEAGARHARYEALARDMAPGEVLLTAHHADDQAETVLLQLLRGGGPAGLAAMPAVTEFEPGWLCRPLLRFDRAALHARAVARSLDWIDDPSNLELDPDRNFLRHRVMPALATRWPSLATTFGRSARHSATASHLLQELADIDLSDVAEGDAIDVGALAVLSPARQRNLLRRWIGRCGHPVPDSRHLERILAEVLVARRDSRACVEWRGACVRRYRDRLYLIGEQEQGWLRGEMAERDWLVSDVLDLGPGLGALIAEETTGDGLAAASLEGECLRVRWRAGGERIRPRRGGRRRRLKNLLQEAGVLPWMRDRLPLIYAAGQLVAVADLWVDGGRTAGPREAGYRIRWDRRPRLR